MRWAAFAFSPLVRVGETHLSRFFPRATASKVSSLAMALTKPAVDVDRVRKDILGSASTSSATHFNSAGDSPMPRPVLERVMEHLECEATVGGYEAAARCSEELEAVYESAAQLINADVDEIALQVCDLSKLYLLYYFYILMNIFLLAACAFMLLCFISCQLCAPAPQPKY